MIISRREFIQSSILLLPIGALASVNHKGYFHHGVASGDPLQNSVIIWTRVSDLLCDGEIVYWELASDKGFKKIQANGEFILQSQNDYTVKIDVVGLQSGGTWYYRFRYKKEYSITGCTRTLPDTISDNGFHMAVVSCNNWEDGYFNAFRAIARKPEIDMVLHLGDYIYEYATGEYGNPLVDRKNLPAHEIITLSDYRARYAQYHTDPDLQELHAARPFVMIWDDHEIANDAFADGAKNHQPEEGSYATRKAAAMQAYMEWLPVRAKHPSEMTRSFSVGDDFILLLADQRAAARTKQLDKSDLTFNDADRVILGTSQFNWLTEQLRNSKATWKLIGNQVMFSGYNVAAGFKLPKYNDWWLGYPYERNKLISFLEKEKISNTVFLTGDHHDSFVLALHKEESFMQYTKSAKEKPLAWELLTPSITSRNGDRMKSEDIIAFEKMLYDPAVNPHLVYADIKNHGYFVAGIFKEKMKVEYFFTGSVLKKTDEEFKAAAFYIEKESFLMIKKA